MFPYNIKTNFWFSYLRIINFEAVQSPFPGLHDAGSQRAEEILRGHEDFKFTASFFIGDLEE